MVETYWNFLERLLGLGVNATDLSFSQMAWRGLIVFSWAVALARFADRRILGHYAGFDIVVLVVLGSVISRGINGDAAFFPSLGASAVLVGLHHLIGALALRFHWFSKVVKGSPRTLVRDGQCDHATLKKCLITEDDLEENLRLNGNTREISEVAEARLERNGTISVVKSKKT